MDILNADNVNKGIDSNSGKLQVTGDPDGQYHKMIEEIEDYAILLLDCEGNIKNWNKGAERIKGYTGSEIIGQNFRRFYLPEDAQNNLPERLLNEAKSKGKASHEGWRVRKDNTRFWGNIVITALHDNDNNVIGYTKVTRDLTQRKLAEDTISQYAAELEFKNKELSQFVSIASHDLQEPLRKIAIFSGMLRDNLNDRELAEKYLDKISSAARRMSHLVKEVLRYSRLSDEMVFLPTDLNKVMETILEDFEIVLTEKKAVVNYPELPVITGVPIQLTQLFANIIGNALKYNRQKPVIDVSYALLTQEETSKIPQLNEELFYVQFKIEDNGIGFSPEHTARIFQMFQRIENNTEDGTGIGLALCKKIIDNHKGYITAESIEEKGTVITFYLPL